MKWFRPAVSALLGPLFRFGKTIEVGSGTTVSWGRLHCKGGGRTSIGKDSIIHCRIDFDSATGRVSIGDRCYIGVSHLVCHTGISIEDDVIISWGVTIVDHDSHALNWCERQDDVVAWARGSKRWTAVSIAPVTVRSKAWIGFGATVLKGVTIGTGAVVGAKAVVTRDVPPFTVVAGNPARVVRRLASSEETVA